MKKASSGSLSQAGLASCPQRQKARPCSHTPPLRHGWLGPVLGLLLALFWVGLAWAAAPLPQPQERVGTGLQINQLRNFTIAEATVIMIDGERLSGPISKERVGTGVRVRAKAAADANAALTAGTLAELHVENALKGPVTSTQPLRVLGQLVTVTADTALQNFATLDQLLPGRIVEVAGFLDTNSSAVAARIKLLHNGANTWKLTGFVTALVPAASQIAVGNQVASLAGVSPESCPAALALGDYVELRAAPISGFVAGQKLDTVNRLRCLTPAPIGTPGASGAIEGLVSAVDSDTAFKLGPLTVNHGPATLYRNGNAGDIDFGVRLEVSGMFASATVFDANRIRFIRPRIRIEAPVTPADIVQGQAVSVLGEVVRFTAQTRDEDGIYASGIPTPRQIELRAYADSQGQLFAGRARIRRDAPHPDEIKLQGPVHAIVAPQFAILGVTVLTGPATLFRDRSGQVVTAQAFFTALEDGVVVEAENATYNATTRQLNPTQVQLGDDQFEDTAPQALGVVEGGANGQIEGTVTLFDPEVFSSDSFE